MSYKETLEKQGKVAISLEVSRELRDAARKKSQATGVPISFVLRRALEKWVADKENKK